MEGGNGKQEPFWRLHGHGIIICGGRAMIRTLQAVYENGAFRPLEPVSCREQERVLLTVQSADRAEEDIVDHEFIAYCETQGDDTVSLEAVRQALAKNSRLSRRGRSRGAR